MRILISTIVAGWFPDGLIGESLVPYWTRRTILQSPVERKRKLFFGGLENDTTIALTFSINLPSFFFELLLPPLRLPLADDGILYLFFVCLAESPIRIVELVSRRFNRPFNNMLFGLLWQSTTGGKNDQDERRGELQFSYPMLHLWLSKKHCVWPTAPSIFQESSLSRTRMRICLKKPKREFAYPDIRWSWGFIFSSIPLKICMIHTRTYTNW